MSDLQKPDQPGEYEEVLVLLTEPEAGLFEPPATAGGRFLIWDC